MTPDRRRATGTRGETLAAEHLERAGYRVLELNFRCARGELDVVAAGRESLVFCEVKTRVAGTRAGPAGPLDAIGPHKRRRLRTLASIWMSEHDGDRPRPATIRFDAIGIILDAGGRLLALEHVEDAF